MRGDLFLSPNYKKFMYIDSFRYYRDYLCDISLKANVATDEGNGRNEMWTLEKEMKLE